MHQLIVIYLTVFSQSASPLCQHEEVRLVLDMQVMEEHMQRIARFKP
jgi:hypothetical protein